MTARQIIQAIETLSPEERSEVKTFLLQEEKPAYEVRYLDSDTARPLIKEILTEHAETFRKLAK